MRGVVLGCAAAILAVVWAAWPPDPEPVIAARAVQIEGVREQRQDVGTFKVRWAVVAELPPAMVQVAEVGRAIEAPENARPPPPAKARRSHAADICARHGMRKQVYGKRWRCRR